jgi:aspartyl-tRNA(Asn)/glutamyl-tRNA(Gln) amidotransferase subunit A
VQPGVATAVDSGLDALAGLGARVELARAPDAADLDLAGAVGLVISRCEAASAHRSLGLDRDRYWEEVREQLALAADIAAVDYLNAQRMRGELRDRLLGAFAVHDVLAMPTVPVVAPEIADFADYLMLLARNAIPWSLVGFPAITVPVGTSEGLPVGLQLVAPPGGEATLVQVARALEAARAS